MTKIELNLRLNEVRGFSTTNNIVNCTPISQQSSDSNIGMRFFNCRFLR